MESSLESEASAALADRLGGARRDVVTVVRYLACCPVSTEPPILPVLLAACDCLDEALVRLGHEPPDSPVTPAPPVSSASLDEPIDDGE